MQMLREHYVNFECSLNIQKQVTPKKMLHEFPTKKKKCSVKVVKINLSGDFCEYYKMTLNECFVSITGTMFV